MEELLELLLALLGGEPSGRALHGSDYVTGILLTGITVVPAIGVAVFLVPLRLPLLVRVVGRAFVETLALLVVGVHPGGNKVAEFLQGFGVVLRELTVEIAIREHVVERVDDLTFRELDAFGLPSAKSCGCSHGWIRPAFPCTHGEVVLGTEALVGALEVVGE